MPRVSGASQMIPSPTSAPEDDFSLLLDTQAVKQAELPKVMQAVASIEPELLRRLVVRFTDDQPCQDAGQAAGEPHIGVQAHLLDEGLDFLFDKYVRAHVRGLAPGRRDLLLHRATELFAPAAKADFGALGGEGERGGPADPGGGARDDHDLALEPPHADPSRCDSRARAAQRHSRAQSDQAASETDRGAEDLAPPALDLFVCHERSLRAQRAPLHGAEVMVVVRGEW